MGTLDFVLLQKLSQQRRGFLELLGVAYVAYELLQRQSNLIWPSICDRDALCVRALSGKSMAGLGWMHELAFCFLSFSCWMV